MNLNKLFIDKGIYRLNGSKDVFLCESCQVKTIGKLVLYKYISKDLYERTTIKYFLNDYVEGNLKGIFVNRENFEMIGLVGNNYILSDNYLRWEK